jgi:hypothetical protein
MEYGKYVLQCETGNLSGGGHCLFKRSAGKERRLTRDNNDNDDYDV